MLREAIARGFNDIEASKTDAAFAPVRGWEDFQKLIAMLE